MAGLGFRTFTAGEVLTAANVQSYLMDQAVMVFASSGARGSAIASPTEGMFSYLSDGDALEFYSGAAWVPFSAGAKGGGTNQVFYENDVDVTDDYTISTDKNAMTAGPITIGTAVTVTIPSGSGRSLVYMGNVRVYGATSGYTELAPPAVAPDGVLSLPSGTGTIAKTTDQGLVHINTTTFSAVSSVSLNNVFTSDYDNYRIVLNGTSSLVQIVAVRFRISGTDTTATNYNSQRLQTNGTSVGGLRSTGLDRSLAGHFDTSWSFNILEVARPFLSAVTIIKGFAADSFSGVFSQDSSSAYTLATSFDGITIFPETGTFTGTIRVYGYKND